MVITTKVKEKTVKQEKAEMEKEINKQAEMAKEMEKEFNKKAEMEKDVKKTIAKETDVVNNKKRTRDEDTQLFDDEDTLPWTMEDDVEMLTRAMR